MPDHTLALTLCIAIAVPFLFYLFLRRFVGRRNEYEAQLWHTIEARDEFLAVLSHELRTPAGVIQGFAQVLTRPDIPQADRVLAQDAILRNSKILSRLIEDLLDISGVTQGTFQLNSSLQDLVSIIEHAVESVRLTIESKGIELESSFDLTAGYVLGDPVRLHQILSNILSNAIKFTPAGGKISVFLKQIGNTVTVEIGDTGIGILPEFLPHVFERFSQQDITIHRRFGGLGLGLAIAKYLVELHEGHIRVSSSGPEKGTKFTIEFPAVGRGPELPVDLAAAALWSAQPLAGMMVLVVDDVPDYLSLLELLFKKYGADTQVASSADRAWEILQSTTPALLVCDIGMSANDGKSLVTKLRKHEAEGGKPRVPAIALTAYARTVDKRDCLDSGFDAHVTKPIDENLLIETALDLIVRSKAVGIAH